MYIFLLIIDHLLTANEKTKWQNSLALENRKIKSKFAREFSKIWLLKNKYEYVKITTKIYYEITVLELATCPTKVLTQFKFESLPRDFLESAFLSL